MKSTEFFRGMHSFIMQIMIIMSIRLIMWSLCIAKVLEVYYVDYVHFMLIVYIIMFMCITYP
jgi:hypothetical protein